MRDYHTYYVEEKNNFYKIRYIKEYCESIIEFIETFDLNNLDNVTIFEKLFLYVKQLFKSYAKILVLDNNIAPNYEELIKTNSQKYLKLLIKKTHIVLINY